MNPLVKELTRYSWIVAVITAAFALLFISIFQTGAPKPFLYSIFVGFRFWVQGLANIAALVMVYKYLSEAPSIKKKTIRYVIGFLFSFVFFFLTEPLERYLSLPKNGAWMPTTRLTSLLFQGAFNNTLVIIVQNLVILRYEKTKSDLENSRLRAANLESANLLLKQQIHPHFLFNALSMLKSLYKTDVRAGEEYLSHLVNFLRASLAEPRSRVSLLRDEIKLCNDYLEMQKIRFENALICTIDIPESVLSGGAVPPFSVQSLIENAIKHNEVTESSPLMINIFYKEDRIFIENNIQARNQIDAPSGKGLINLLERYKILSDEEVIIRQDKQVFSVSIKVLANEAGDHRR
jgi:LytS/YehU family sensor histidine kinase